MTFERLVEWIGAGIDVAGVAAIVVGSVVVTVLAVDRLRQGTAFAETYRFYREGLGRAILLGLEFLVAADIIRTVAISPTLEGVSILGLIVLIRTFLSMTLQMEVEGRWPWQRS